MANFIKSDLEFILQQILIAEAHAAGEELSALLPNSLVPFGLRTVDGSFNNLILGQSAFGAADQLFPLFLPQSFRNEQDEIPFAGISNTNYATTGPVAGNVIDTDPRIISNLIADQTSNNPSAVQAFVESGQGALADGTQINPATGLPFATGTLLDLNNVPIPAGRWGEASDLQGVFVFLASDAAAYVTGAVIPVDGGWLVR